LSFRICPFVQKDSFDSSFHLLTWQSKWRITNIGLNIPYTDPINHHISSETSSAVSNIECEVFSEPFYVYSAKRFPGMIGEWNERLQHYRPRLILCVRVNVPIESTSLSRCFAKQGVKIPVRKDSSKSRGDDYWIFITIITIAIIIIIIITLITLLLPLLLTQRYKHSIYFDTIQ
jgi:hypothetical protein